MKKRIVAIPVCILLIISSLAIVSPSKALKINGNTLYVGGSGPGNYSTIQSAIDAANPDDTIFVYSGTYNEYLYLDKTINLIGENKDTTSINYNTKYHSLIILLAPYVVISGFTLYNPNPDLVEYIFIYGEGNYESISNCKFYNSPLHYDDGTVGVNILNSSYNRIYNCTFLYNDDEGICLNQGSNHNIVENCVFTNCGDGIELQNSSFNIINNCTIKDGTHNGISITYREPFTSNNNTISNCNIYNNQQGGIYLNNAYNNIINNCSLDRNQYFGIYVSGNKSHNNFIFDNAIYSNIIQSLGKGLQLGWSCHNNTFYNNHILNYNYGVYIENTFHKNDTNNNLFYHNNIIANTISAYDECTNIWDNDYPIGGNYWDDYVGKDNNGDGFGDIPYNISGRDNKDNYPLMKPWNFSNNPPNKPSKPRGQTNGKAGVEYVYYASTTDPDRDDVFYLFDWGNSMTSFIMGPYPSGEEGNASNIWFEDGNYEVRVKAIDEFGAESEWSDPLVVSMPKSYIHNQIIELLTKIVKCFPLLVKILNQTLI